MPTFDTSVSTYKRSDNKYQIRIRLTHKRKIAYIPTPYYVKGELLNKHRGITSLDLVMQCNSLIDQYARKLITLGDSINDMEVEAVKAFILIREQAEADPEEIDLLQYFRDKVEELKVTRKPKTISGYITALNKLEEFTNGKLLVNNFTPDFLSKFEIHLRTVPGKKKGSKKAVVRSTGVRLYMTYIKYLTGFALIDELIIKDPFRKGGYKMPKRDIPIKRNLDVETIRKIFNHRPKTDLQEQAIDVFKIIFLTQGMNFPDLYNLPKPRKNRLNYERAKTSGKREDRAFISVLVTAQLAELIEKYSDPKRCFNFYHHYVTHENLGEAVNNGLKEICEAMKIPKVTSYYARHSFGNIARNVLHYSKEQVGKCLNHSQRTVTDEYLEPDFSDNDKLLLDVVNHIYESKTLRVIKFRAGS